MTVVDGSLRYRCRYFDLYYSELTGTTTTVYRDGGYTACPVVDDDTIHANALGITPQHHRFIHEFTHHVVGDRIYKKDSSPILYRQAHGIPHDDYDYPIGSGRGGWREEEWLVSALTYHLFGREDKDFGARLWLSDRGHNVESLLWHTRWFITNLLDIHIQVDNYE